jgi:pimeloyl-[acyl-carrier protein] methyl ester esterase
VTVQVVLLPGMDGTGELLADLTERLAAHRKVHVIAYPIQRHFSNDELVALVLSQAPAEPFVILGESFSGPIAIDVAARLPRVAGLILASSFVKHPLPSFLAPCAQTLRPGWLPKSVINAGLLGSSGTAKIKDRLHATLAKLPPDLLRARLNETLRVDKRKALRNVQCPILYLHGRMDRLVGPRHIREVTAIQPNCQVQQLDAPHMLLATHAMEAAELIEQFCQRIEIVS